MPRVLRTTRNALTVPMETWVRGPRTVHLIGMSHLADPRFYTDTSAILDDLENDGAVVYAEGVRYADGTVPGVKLLQTLVMHGIFGDLVHQSLALPKQKHWRNVDLTFEERREQAEDPAALEKVLEAGLPIHDRRATTTIGALMRPALVPALSMIGALTNVGIIPSERELLDLRNQRVMDAVLAEEHDAALVWGAAHLPGMGQFLASAGYELAARTWRPVMAQRRMTDGLRAAADHADSTSEWPWEGQDIPETVPASEPRALLRERGRLTTQFPPE